jgi:hypothetical protein
MKPAEVEKVSKKLSDIIMGIEETSKTAAQKRQQLEQLGESLKNVDPALREKIIPKIEDIAERYDLAKEASKQRNLMNSVFAMRSHAIGLGQVAGQVERIAVREPLKSAKDVLRRGYEYMSAKSPEELTNMSRKMIERGTARSQEYARVLEKAALSPERRKNAILFSLMQQPGFRQAIAEEEQVQESTEGQVGE